LCREKKAIKKSAKIIVDWILEGGEVSNKKQREVLKSFQGLENFYASALLFQEIFSANFHVKNIIDKNKEVFKEINQARVLS